LTTVCLATIFREVGPRRVWVAAKEGIVRQARMDEKRASWRSRIRIDDFSSKVDEDSAGRGCRADFKSIYLAYTGCLWGCNTTIGDFGGAGTLSRRRKPRGFELSSSSFFTCRWAPVSHRCRKWSELSGIDALPHPICMSIRDVRWDRHDRQLATKCPE
jgi:hypothetical protein